MNHEHVQQAVSDGSKATQSTVKQALLKITQLKQRIGELESQASVPIAIVGAGVRAPAGIRNLEQFWRFLCEGGCAVGEVPASRWDVEALYDPSRSVPGTVYTRHGAFVDAIDEFDAGFFNISGREAEQMDPQQRVLLETAWEALENAGIDPSSIEGSDCGVFVGLMNQDYADLCTGPGTSASVASGRLAYVLGAQGPTLTMDTACSSGLVALHLAGKALMRGECSTAIVAAVNLQVTAKMTIAECAGHMLSVDGRCKTFDSDADGFGRSDGCVVLVLKREDRARIDRDRILAVVRGSAVNHDGASGGLTVPNGPAQQRVLGAALRDAGLEPGDIDLIEAHGTGTALGDPIELSALTGVYGRERDRALYVTSVKTNFGHMEAAAGLVGILKAALAVHHGVIPPHLHLRRLNPNFDWSGSPVSVPTQLTPWPQDRTRRRAAVSAFGISGTNAHVILEQPADTADVAEDVVSTVPLLLKVSARNASALRDLAQRHAEALRNSTASTAALERTLNLGRADFEHRLVVVAENAAQAATRFTGFADGQDVRGLYHGLVDGSERQGLAWLFSGQGSQYPGMGHRLFDAELRFREALQEAEEALRPHLPVPLLEVMHNGPADRLNDTRFAQPALFALQYALGRFWANIGLAPAVMLGHSVGEYAAACLAGIFSLDDAARLITARGRLMSERCVPGAMAAVFAPASEIRLGVLAADVSFAAFNGPGNTVISGEIGAVERALERLSAYGLNFQRLDVSHGFHSPTMRPMLDEFAAVARQVSYRDANVPIIANLTGVAGEPAMSSAQYWIDHVLAPVRFADGVATLATLNVGASLEIGAQGTLSAMLRRCPGTESIRGTVSLQRNVDDAYAVRQAFAQLYVAGIAGDWKQVSGRSAVPVEAPTYAFQRQRYWVPETGNAGSREAVEILGYDTVWEPLGVTHAEGSSTGALVLVGAPTALECWVPLLAERHQGALEAISTADPQALARDLARVATVHADTDLVLLDGAGTGPELATSLQVLQAATAQRRLWFLRRLAADASPDPTVAGALVDVAATELQLAWGGSLWVEDVDAGSAANVLSEIRGCHGEDAVRWIEGRRHIRRLQRVRQQQGTRRVLDSDAQYWITGGLGGLGLQVASALIERGARHLVLLGRRGEDGVGPEVAVRLAAWRAGGVRVDAPAVDVTSEAVVQTWVARAGPALRGVVHVAGVEDRCALADLTPARIERMLTAKVRGTEVLQAVLPWSQLDFFVATSSVASLWGGVGSLHYAAANAWLETWVLAARHRGLPCSALRLGPVRGTGMVDASLAAALAQNGLLPMSPDRALCLLDRAMSTTAAVSTACDVDEVRLAASMQTRRVRPLFANFASGSMAGAMPSDAVPGRWAGEGTGDLQQRIWHALERSLRDVLRLAAAVEVGANTPVQQLGVDSLLAIEVRDRLSAVFEQTLPSTFVFDHGTPGAMVAEIQRRIEGTAPSIARPAAFKASGHAVAVIGMGCRLPGGANDPEAFWKLLQAGDCAIDDAPERLQPERWLDRDPDAVDRAYTLSAGLIDDVEHFAAGFFGISPREALCMDPQQRLVLETSWAAIERAGLHPDVEAMRSTGVFVGVGSNEYAQLLLRDPAISDSMGHVPTGNALNAIAGRIAFTFDFQGPCAVVDTACSSSLVALQNAVQALRRGDCDFALAGGVNLALSPESFVMLCKGHMLGPSGRCKAFDSAADGYVRGEGCGMLLLRRLEDAERDGDPILGVVRGCAINQDGRSSSLTAPNGMAQQRVLRAALEDAGVDAAQVAYVEAHGTGTPLGDPIEAHALSAIYAPAARGPGAPLLVGSVKSNIGHLEAAAGIAGVIKTLLMLQHDRVVPSLHHNRLNPNIEVLPGTIAICTQEQVWPAGRARIAGVSSFGFSGTNAHVLLERYVPAGVADRPETPGVDLFVLSARSERELRAHAARIADWLEQAPAGLDFVGACASSRSARSALGDWRMLVSCADIGALRSGLQEVAVDKELTVAIVGNTRSRSVDAALLSSVLHGQDQNVASLAARWLRGGAVAWPTHAGTRRVTLPSHPFERQRFWPKPAASAVLSPPVALPGRRLDLLDRDDVVYESTVSARWPAHVRDHRIFGEVLLAGASHIGAVLAAARAEWPGSGLALGDIAFEQARTLREEGADCQWQLTLQKQGPRQFLAQSHSRAREPGARAVRHFSAQLELSTAAAVQVLRAAPMGPPTLDAAALYKQMAELGYHLGDSFRWLERGWEEGAGSLWRLRSPELPEGGEAYPLYPGLIDSCFHAIGERMRSNEAPGSEWIFVPYSVARIELTGSAWQGKTLWCRAWLDDESSTDVQNASGGAELFGSDGTVVARIERFRARRARRSRLHGSTGTSARDLAYAWAAVDINDGFAPSGSGMLLLGDPAATSWLGPELPRARRGGSAAAVEEIDSCEVTHVVLALDGEADGDDLNRRLLETLQVLCRLVRPEPAALRRISLVLSGCADRHIDACALQAARRALFRTLIHEQPSLRFQVIEVAGALGADSAALAARGLASVDHGLLRVEDGHLQNRFLRALALPPQIEGWQASPSGQYVVTGGLGGLGIRLCSWLLSAGAKRVVLLSRHQRPLPPDLEKQVLAHRAHVEVRACEAHDPVQLAALRESLASYPVEVFFHLAGTHDDALIGDLTEAQVLRVLEPKIDGTSAWLALAEQVSASRFAVFSSLAAHLGVPGQCAYAAANAAMEALCHGASHRTPSTLSLAFGPWAGAGMVGRQSASHRAHAASLGINELDPDQTFELVGHLLGSDQRGTVAVLDFDWRRFADGAPADLLAQLPPHALVRTAPPADAAPGTARARIQAAGTNRNEECLNYCIELLATVTVQPGDAIDPDAAPVSLGVDSLLAIEIRRRIRRELEVDLDAPALLDARSVRGLADHLAQLLDPEQDVSDRRIPPTGRVKDYMLSMIEVEL